MVKLKIQKTPESSTSSGAHWNLLEATLGFFSHRDIELYFPQRFFPRPTGVIRHR